MTATPPILPSPDGWRQPTVMLPSVSRKQLVAGLGVSAVGAYGAMGLIVHALQACTLLDAGNRFAFAILIPPLAAGMWVVFYIGVYVSKSQPALLRLLAGTVLALAGAFVVVTAMVPDSPPNDYGDVNHADYPECGPGGIPTWWPSWLPS